MFEPSPSSIWKAEIFNENKFTGYHSYNFPLTGFTWNKLSGITTFD